MAFTIRMGIPEMAEFWNILREKKALLQSLLIDRSVVY